MSNLKRNFTNDKYSTTPTFKTIVDSEKKAKKKDPIRVLYKQTGKNPRVRIIVQIDRKTREFQSLSQEDIMWFTNDLNYRSYNAKIPKVRHNNSYIENKHLSTNENSRFTINEKQDLHIGINQAYDLFKQDDFPTITIGKRKTVTIASYLLWKISKNGGDV